MKKTVLKFATELLPVYWWLIERSVFLQRLMQ